MKMIPKQSGSRSAVWHTSGILLYPALYSSACGVVILSPEVGPTLRFVM